MPSFDIVSEIDKVELKNAVDNTEREIGNRFDFRGVVAEVSLKELTVTLKSESDFQTKQLLEVLRNQCTKRGITMAGAEIDDEATHSGKTFNLEIKFKQGIEQPLAKQIIKLLKEAKVKVQASIQGDKVRVTGKKRDDLQEAIALIKNSDIELPLQYENFRD